MEARELAPIRIGIPLARLSSTSPRGVVRAARAITEHLATDSGLRIYAISDPLYNNHDVLFEAWDLGEWLERNPMTMAQSDPTGNRMRSAGELRVRAIVILKRVITLLGMKEPAKRALRICRSAPSRAKDAIKALISAVGLTTPAKTAWRRLRRSLATSSESPSSAHTTPSQSTQQGTTVSTETSSSRHVANSESNYISLNDLDFVLSFECYDAIWDWPTELFKCKMIGVFHDAIPFRINEGPALTPERYYIAVAKMVQRAHWIACDSYSSLRDLRDFFPHATSKSCVIHLGHDRERFLPENLPAPPSWLRRRVSSKRRVRKIAMIGELEPRKNQAGVFRACRQLAAEFPSEQLLLVLLGQLPEHYPYQLLTQQIPANVEVDYRGYVPDDEIASVLRACDVFVYPSLWEGFGIPVLEAMSAGVPVVCSENSSLAEVGGRFVIYCDPYDPSSIGAGIKQALNMNSSQREKWTQDARVWAERFTWSRTARQFMEFLNSDSSRTMERGPLAKLREEVHPNINRQPLSGSIRPLRNAS